jgi:two-component system, sensor histidine kinase and response regulator
MPTMDGFELAEFMRGVERSKRVPIIFITAANNEPLPMFRGYESGAVDVLFKPLNMEILRQKAAVFFELHRQREQLAQAVRVREDVLAMVSHDLRSPLAVIHTTTSMLLNPKYKMTPEQVVEGHQRMLRNVELMNRMIGDLFDMVNLCSGRLSIEQRHEDLAQLLRESAAVHEEPAQKKGIRIECEIERGHLKAFCDRTRLLQVFANLLGNAVKFCNPGDTIRVHARSHGDTAIIEISDSGPGIAADDLPHILEAYWSAGKHRSAGSGLGLYIARGIVEAHGGKIRVSSKPGVGTTFTISLPLETNLPAS